MKFFLGVDACSPRWLVGFDTDELLALASWKDVGEHIKSIAGGFFGDFNVLGGNGQESS